MSWPNWVLAVSKMLKKKNNSNKIALRAFLKKARQELSPDYVNSASESICNKIIASEHYHKAKVILAYLAFGKEVNCDSLIARAIKDGKVVCIPFIVDKESFVPARLETFDNLVLDRYGIRTVSEPFVKVPQADIDLVLVPGLAFGQDGSRIGMGAGYYDRFLAISQATTIGLAYRELMQDNLPMDEHDVIVQNVVNEDGLISAIKN